MSTPAFPRPAHCPPAAHATWRAEEPGYSRRLGGRKVSATADNPTRAVLGIPAKRVTQSFSRPHCRTAQLATLSTLPAMYSELRASTPPTSVGAAGGVAIQRGRLSSDL